MPDYEHLFQCTACRKYHVFKNQSNDSDDPPIPSLIHSRVIETKLAGIPRARRVVGDDAEINCNGRLMFRRTTQLTPAAVPAPVIVRASDKSREYAMQHTARDGVNTICAAYDHIRDRAKKGVNAHGLRKDQLHVSLKYAIDSCDNLEPWPITNCAEIHAVHRLLQDGSIAKNIRVHSRTVGAGPKPPCENCQGWLQSDGANTYKIRYLK